MVKKILSLWLGLSFILGSSALAATTQLFLFGGGYQHPEALQQWLNAGDPQKSTLLLIHWGTNYPQETCQDFTDRLALLSSVQVVCAPHRDVILAEKKNFLQQLDQARAVFFSGGDQSKIMLILSQNPELKEAITLAYQHGLPIAGTSAGTAIQSKTMIVGTKNDQVLTGPGLGLLIDVIVDQHFIKRGREPRLKAALLKHPERLGLGVDEDAALKITDNHLVSAITGPSVFIHQIGANQFVSKTLQPGDQIDLQHLKTDKPE